MTKIKYLENKGYHVSLSADFRKIFIFKNPAFIVYARIDGGFKEFYIEPCAIYCQKDIDNLQIAYNNVKRDFEEIQKYEED